MLRDLVDRYAEQAGSTWKTQLATTLKRHQGSVERWLKKGPPSADEAYELALACGATHEEASAIAADFLKAKVG